MGKIELRQFSTGANEANLEGGLSALRRRQAEIDGLYPVIYHLDITGRCNLGCLYCQRSFFVDTKHEFIKSDMSDEVFDKLVPYLKHAKLVALLSMLGEPLVVKSLPRWWRAVIDAGAKPQTTTNGTFLTEELADLFTGTGGRLKMSIDTFDQPTLSLLRPAAGGGVDAGMKADVLRDRLRLIERYRRVHEEERFQFGVNLCVTAKNLGSAIETMEECLRHARVDVFTLASFRMPRDERGMYHRRAESLSLDFDDEEQRKSWRAIVSWAARTKAERGIHFVFPYGRAEWRRLLDDETLALHEESFESRDGGEPEDYYCCVPWLKTGVLADGTVIPCHLLYWPHPELSMGSLAESSFDEIWNGERYVELRRRMAEGRDLGACADCRSWWRFYTPQRVD